MKALLAQIDGQVLLAYCQLFGRSFERLSLLLFPGLPGQKPVTSSEILCIMLTRLKVQRLAKYHAMTGNIVEVPNPEQDRKEKRAAMPWEALRR